MLLCELGSSHHCSLVLYLHCSCEPVLLQGSREPGRCFYTHFVVGSPLLAPADCPVDSYSITCLHYQGLGQFYCLVFRLYKHNNDVTIPHGFLPGSYSYELMPVRCLWLHEFLWTVFGKCSMSSWKAPLPVLFCWDGSLHSSGLPQSLNPSA